MEGPPKWKFSAFVQPYFSYLPGFRTHIYFIVDCEDKWVRQVKRLIESRAELFIFIAADFKNRYLGSVSSEVEILNETHVQIPAPENERISETAIGRVRNDI